MYVAYDIKDCLERLGTAVASCGGNGELIFPLWKHSSSASFPAAAVAMFRLLEPFYGTSFLACKIKRLRSLDPSPFFPHLLTSLALLRITKLFQKNKNFAAR